MISKADTILVCRNAGESICSLYRLWTSLVGFNSSVKKMSCNNSILQRMGRSLRLIVLLVGVNNDIQTAKQVILVN